MLCKLLISTALVSATARRRWRVSSRRHWMWIFFGSTRLHFALFFPVCRLPRQFRAAAAAAAAQLHHHRCQSQHNNEALLITLDRTHRLLCQRRPHRRPMPRATHHTFGRGLLLLRTVLRLRRPHRPLRLRRHLCIKRRDEGRRSVRSIRYVLCNLIL